MDPLNSLNEPFLAIDPANGMAMALGAHSAPTVGLVSAASPGADVVQLAVYFTQDGGASWTRTEVPRVALPSAFGPIEARLYYDPALAFDGHGVLHFAGIASNDLGAAGGGQWGAKNVPFYTSTADHGKTWTTPIVLDPAFSDRTFIAASPDGGVFVDWGRYAGRDITVQGAWSLDSGKTWTGLADTGCRGFSPFIVADGIPEFMCVQGNSSYPDVGQLERLDTGSGKLSVVGTVPGLAGYRARLSALPGGGLAVVNDGDAIRGSASFDGGATWSKPLDLLKQAKLSPTMGAFLKWGAADPWGGVHLEVGFGTPGCSGGDRGVPGTCRIVHVVYDPMTGRVLEPAVLSDADGVKAYRVPGTIAPPEEVELGDDFYAFAFAPDHGVLLWTRDGGTDFTWVKPT